MQIFTNEIQYKTYIIVDFVCYMFYISFIDKKEVIYYGNENEVFFDVNFGGVESRVKKEGSREWANFERLHSIGFGSRCKKVKNGQKNNPNAGGRGL